MDKLQLSGRMKLVMALASEMGRAIVHPSEKVEAALSKVMELPPSHRLGFYPRLLRLMSGSHGERLRSPYLFALAYRGHRGVMLDQDELYQWKGIYHAGLEKCSLSHTQFDDLIGLDRIMNEVGKSMPDLSATELRFAQQASRPHTSVKDRIVLISRFYLDVGEVLGVVTDRHQVYGLSQPKNQSVGKKPLPPPSPQHLKVVSACASR